MAVKILTCVVQHFAELVRETTDGAGLSTDTKQLLSRNPDYLFSGHSHVSRDVLAGQTRRINPGALHDAETFSVAVLDLLSDMVEFVTIAA